MVLKQFHLENLGCANCAAKIEKEVAKIPGVKYSNVDFISKKLKFEVSSAKEKQATSLAIKLVKKIEPDVTVHTIDALNTINEKNSFINSRLYALIVSVSIFLVAMFVIKDLNYQYILYFIAYFIAAKDVLWKAFKNLFSGNIFDENFLLSIASLGAILIGEITEGIAVMLFYSAGMYFQDLAVDKSRRSIKQLMDLQPDYVNVEKDGKILILDPKEVKLNEIILIKPGEKIPLDCVIIEGSSFIDTKPMTGEPIPRLVNVGDTLISGTVNKNSLLKAKVTSTYSNSSAYKVLQLIEESASRKSPTENFITNFARYYTPIVIAGAVLLATIPPLMNYGSFYTWLHRSLVFLVISCPCALVISIPLSYFGGIANASKHGILIKGSNYIDALKNAAIIIFDKTGTLTKGNFEVTNINPVTGFTQEQLMIYASTAELHSNHPIAISIKKYCKSVLSLKIFSHEEIIGYGTKSITDQGIIIAGNSKLMENEKININEVYNSGTIVHVAKDGNYVGYIQISDQIKDESKFTIEQLKKLNIEKTVMLTGDSEKEAKLVAAQINVDDYFAGLLPHEKVDVLEKYISQLSSKEKLVFVGDGLNDAPVLSRADVGIVMGDVGSDAAIEAADVIITDGAINKVNTLLKISHKTHNIAIQNVVFSIGIKVLFLFLGAIGIASLWGAVFADVGVTIIAILNASRALRT